MVNGRNIGENREWHHLPARFKPVKIMLLVSKPNIMALLGPKPPSPSQWARGAPCAPKATNMEEYAHFTPNATLFTRTQHPFTFTHWDDLGMSNKACQS